MKRLVLGFAVFSLCTLSVADSLRSDIESMSRTMRTVMMKKDLNLFTKTVKGNISKDFKYSEGGRSMSFDKMVDGMKMSFASMSKVTAADSKILSLKEKGSSATCVMSHRMVA